MTIHQKKPVWICAKHGESDKDDDASASEENEENSFIDDGSISNMSGEEDYVRNAMDEITKDLSKATPQDMMNTDKYIVELSRYQLQKHTHTCHLSICTCRERL